MAFNANVVVDVVDDQLVQDLIVADVGMAIAD
jgi:hypothetical protein